MWQLAWLDVRWRIVLMAVANSALLLLFLDDAVPGDVWMRRLDALPLVFCMNAIVLAGAGIPTNVSQRPRAEPHASVLYILSLPISRRRLVLVREAVGLLATWLIVTITLLVVWSAAASLRSDLPVAHFAEYVLCVLAAAAVAFGVSAVFATVLDQLWQTYASLAVVAVVVKALPITRIWRHALRQDGAPWTVTVGLLVAVVIAAVLAAVSVRIVERKQF